MFNPYLVIPLVAWIVAQALKFIISAARGRADVSKFYVSGGMPSGHSAVVCSLAATAYILAGAHSPIFGVTVILAAIVMYDSFGVRRASGEQAAALNRLIASNDRDGSLPRLREIFGHTPLEVTVGAIIGIVLAGIFNLDHLTGLLNFLSTSPGRVESLVYAIIFGLLVLFGFGSRLWFKRRYRGSRVFKDLSSQLFWKSESLGVFGLIAVFGQYEGLPYLSWRVWPLAILLAVVLWDGYIWQRFHKILPAELADLEDSARKRRWFEQANRKKRRK